MTDLEIGWFVGVIEGEGCIQLRKNANGVRNKLSLTVTSVDKDLLERLVEVTGVGRITGPTQPYASAGQRSPWWSWNVHKRRDVARLLLMAYPLLGARRRRRCAEVVEACWGSAYIEA